MNYMRYLEDYSFGTTSLGLSVRLPGVEAELLADYTDPVISILDSDDFPLTGNRCP